MGVPIDESTHLLPTGYENQGIDVLGTLYLLTLVNFCAHPAAMASGIAQLSPRLHADCACFELPRRAYKNSSYNGQTRAASK
jgi:hypothetical protein